MLLLTVDPLSGRPLSEVTVLLLLPLLPPRDTAPLPVREPLLERLVVVVVVVGRFTWLLLLGVATVLRLVVELLRFTWLLLLGAATVPRLLEALLRLTCGVAEVLRLVLELLRLTCGVAEVLRLVLELLRLTCGEAEVLRLVLELLRLTCGVAEVLRLTLELELRLTVGAVDWLLERETAAVWLLLLVLPPCERLRPGAEASDALKIRHPMRAKLIMIFVTEVFIIVSF